MVRVAIAVLGLCVAGGARADFTPSAPSPPSSEVRAFWPAVGAARFRVQLLGQFSTRARFKTGTTDSPHDVTPLVVPHLDAMNADLHAAADETLRELGLAFMDTDEVPYPVPPLTVQPDNDVHFRLVIEIGPTNDPGGHNAGTDVIARLRSFHRREELAARGFATVAIERDQPRQLRAVRAALRTAVVEALREFRAVIGRPVIAVDTAFELANLDEMLSKLVTEQIVPCMIDKLGVVDSALRGQMGARYHATLQLRERAAQTEEQLVDEAARRLVLVGANKGRGCLPGTLLTGFRVAVHRTAPRELSVSFNRP